MTASDRFDRRLSGGLEQLAEPRFPEYLDDVLAVTSRRRQRPAWTFPGRWFPMVEIARQPVAAQMVPWRLAATVVALLLFAAVAALVVTGSKPNLPAPIGPARNGLLAYDSGNGIAVTDPDSGTTRLIPGTTAADHGPIWSPDGTTLGIVRIAAGVASLAVIHPDGSGLKAFPNAHVVQEQQAHNDPSEMGWSTDSRTLAYISADDHRMHAIKVDDATDRAISPIEATIDSMAWRPGSNEVVARLLTGSTWRLSVVGLDGKVRDLGPRARHALELAVPTWSVDGSQVAYELEDANSNYEIHVINADGTGDRVVTAPTQNAFYPLWSPAGPTILYYASVADGGYRLYTTSAEGSRQPVAISAAFQVANVSWSPDGQSVIAQFDTDPQVWILDPHNASAPRRAPYQAGPESWPAWQRVAP